jgi:hypothetical protein
MTTKTTKVTGIEADEAEAALQLLEGALDRNGMSKSQMRDALESGLGRAMWEGPPSLWTAATAAERHRDAAGRLLLRLGRELGLPLASGGIGPGYPVSAVSVARELLA